MAKRIVLACMDRRLNAHLDENYNDGNTLFLRNAGANAHCLLQSIGNAVNSGEIDSIVVLGHTDCGAMKVVFDAIVNRNGSYCNGIRDKIVNLFEDYGYLKHAGERLQGLDPVQRSRAEASVRRRLEKRNVDLQVGFLKGLTRSFPHVKVEGSLVDLKKINALNLTGNGRHAIVLSRECGSRFDRMCSIANTDPHETYVLESRDIKETITDLQLAVEVLHIRDIRLVAPDSALKDGLASDLEFLKGMSSGFLKGSDIAIAQA